MDSVASQDQVVEYYNARLEYMAIRKSRHERVFKGLDRCNLEVGKTVLDLGCGTGITSIYMARQGCRVFAVDIADRLIDYAKEKNKNKNVTYFNADATKVEFDQLFDLITIVDLMEHLHPDSIGDFMKVINGHAHQQTLVYLNIPIADFTRWGRGKLEHQIIESEIGLGSVVNLFDSYGFTPAVVEVYGLGSPLEYYEIIFVTKDHLEFVWEQVYNQKKSSVQGDMDESDDSLDGDE